MKPEQLIAVIDKTVREMQKEREYIEAHPQDARGHGFTIYEGILFESLLESVAELKERLEGGG